MAKWKRFWNLKRVGDEKNRIFEKPGFLKPGFFVSKRKFIAQFLIGYSTVSPHPCPSP
jgi:hypothetical protein